MPLVSPALMAVPGPDGTLDVRDGAGRVLLAGCYARAALADGATYDTRGGRVGAGDGLTIEAASPGRVVRPDGDIRLRWRVEPHAGGLALGLEVSNAGDRPFTLERLDVLVAPAGLAGSPYADLSLLQAGWQSWSFSTPVAPAPQHHRAAEPPMVAPMLPPDEAARFRSSGLALVRAPGQPGLLAGFTSARAFEGTLAIQPDLAGHRLTASSHLAGRRLGPGERVRSERLLLLAGQPDADALAAYAAAAPADMGAHPRGHAPTGWCSWYRYFTAVDEAAMARNLDVLVAERRRMPVEVVQLDDGYQTAIGDWLSVNHKFPAGMRALADRVHAAGFQAGLWLAPFVVGEDSAVFAEHPDWVLRDAAGDAVVALHNWGVRCHPLDLTHPAVLAHLREVVRVVVDEWGYDYLKLDFLYAGALRGVRHDADATGVMAYRRGLAAIREAAGGAFLLGSGAPFLPSLGLVDGMRVGPDTAPDWGHPDPSGTQPSLLNAIRSTLAHGWMHGRWWVNDPDCLIVRREASRLTEAEVRTWATVVALSGGMVLLSDDLAALSPDRAAIVPRTLPPLGVAARPLAPCHDGVPTRLVTAAERGGRRWYLAAAFNWADEPAELAYNPADWPGAPTCPYWLLDLWSGEALGPLEGPVALGATPPHGVRLLLAAPALDRPHLVGSTLTLAGGAVDVAGEAWTDHALTISLRCPGEHVGELVIAVPPGWAPIDRAAEGGVLRVRVVLEDAADVVVAFRPA